MEPGFLAHPLAEGSRQVAWHPGAPQPENINYLGIEVGQTWEVRLDPDRLEPITWYRCTGCGLLEAYAH